MHDLTGKNWIGSAPEGRGSSLFQAYDPAQGQLLDPPFHEATSEELDRALRLAEGAFDAYRREPPGKRAAFLRRIAAAIEALGELLIERAGAETALPSSRLQAERSRTIGQIRLFADLIEEGSWVGARIDTGDPDRKPQPKPDVRRMLIPLGPVSVFGASNFPFAFSVAGGDTISALAAGNPVVYKAHPAHPGTSEYVARAILEAAGDSGMPNGVFSLIQGRSPEVGAGLVRHPLTCAVAFTGSLRTGRTLLDLAAERPDPIPVYAEMGSINPVFLLPSALESRAVQIAAGLRDSIILGNGQFCTNPGFIVGIAGSALEAFLPILVNHLRQASCGSMLYPGILEAYEDRLEDFQKIPGVRLLAESSDLPRPERTEARPTLLATDFQTLSYHPKLASEVFGPSSLFVHCKSMADMMETARRLEGQLTASIHGTPAELDEYRPLIEVLQQKAGRLIFNGFPTGVEVCHAMHHGGPYPATTDVRSTSVGSAAILRFVRPVCFQNFPQSALPPELQDENPAAIWRLVNGEWTKS